MRQSVWKDERGVALPMGVLLLLVLTALMLAFVSLAQTEPMIAANHMLATQARAQAEAGFERAVWALSQGSIAVSQVPAAAVPANAIDPAALPANGSQAPTPYNANVDLVALPDAYAAADPSHYMTSGTTGGFVVRVTRTGPNEREIVAIGYAPANTGPTRSHRKIQATVEKLPDMGLNAPCALCVKGELSVGGTSQVDSTVDTTCGNKLGALSVGDLYRGGGATIKGAAADGNTTPNQTTCTGPSDCDYKQNQPPSSFDGITLSSNDFKTLRKLAKDTGTYFGPGYPNGGTTAVSSPAWTGSVHFSASNKVGNGIVFIDTVSGQDIPSDLAQQNPADFANVLIDGNPFIGGPPGLPGDFQGWIIVNGSLAISGSMKINGLVYTVNDLTYNGTGTGEINGLAVSQNIRDVTATAISTAPDPDSTTIGNSRVKFNCANTRRWDFIPQNFTLKPGTYRELSD